MTYTKLLFKLLPDICFLPTYHNFPVCRLDQRVARFLNHNSHFLRLVGRVRLVSRDRVVLVRILLPLFPSRSPYQITVHPHMAYTSDERRLTPFWKLGQLTPALVRAMLASLCPPSCRDVYLVFLPVIVDVAHHVWLHGCHVLVTFLGVCVRPGAGRPGDVGETRGLDVGHGDGDRVAFINVGSSKDMYVMGDELIYCYEEGEWQHRRSPCCSFEAGA